MLGRKKKMSFTVYQFDDYSHHWQRVIEYQNKRDQLQQTWSKFTRELENKYITHVTLNTREREFMDLIQGNQTLVEYEAEFHRLIHFAPHYKDDEPRKNQEVCSKAKS